MWRIEHLTKLRTEMLIINNRKIDVRIFKFSMVGIKYLNLD